MSCSVFGCRNKFSSKALGMSFHELPTNKQMRQKWLQAIEPIQLVPSTKIRICSDHFKSSDLDRSSIFRTRLVENAVPSLFGNRSRIHKAVARKTVQRDPTSTKMKDVPSSSSHITSKSSVTFLSHKETKTDDDEEEEDKEDNENLEGDNADVEGDDGDVEGDNGDDEGDNGDVEDGNDVDNDVQMEDCNDYKDIYKTELMLIKKFNAMEADNMNEDMSLSNLKKVLEDNMQHRTKSKAHSPSSPDFIDSLLIKAEPDTSTTDEPSEKENTDKDDREIKELTMKCKEYWEIVKMYRLRLKTLRQTDRRLQARIAKLVTTLKNLKRKAVTTFESSDDELSEFSECEIEYIMRS